MIRFGRQIILTACVLTAAIGLTLSSFALPPMRAILVGMNVATMLCYGYDKYVARAGGRRIPEAALHILSAVGGTPGAFVGQLLFQHKTRASRFRLVFWAIAAVQVVVLLVYIPFAEWVIRKEETAYE